MKTIIGQNAFITKFKYSKVLTPRQYEIIELEDKVAALKAKEAGEPVPATNPIRSLKRNQRVTGCYIMFGNKDEKGMRDIVADTFVVNHPDETFERSEGRKRAFEKSLDVLFGSPMLLRLLDIPDAEVARRQFIDGFNAERGKKVIPYTKG